MVHEVFSVVQCRVQKGYPLQAREEQGCQAGSSRGTSAGQGFSGHGRWGECAAARRRDRLTRCSPRSLPRSPHWVAEAERRNDTRGAVSVPSERLPPTTHDVFVLRKLSNGTIWSGFYLARNLQETDTDTFFHSASPLKHRNSPVLTVLIPFCSFPGTFINPVLFLVLQKKKQKTSAHH